MDADLWYLIHIEQLLVACRLVKESSSNVLKVRFSEDGPVMVLFYSSHSLRTICAKGNRRRGILFKQIIHRHFAINYTMMQTICDTERGNKRGDECFG